MNASITYWRKLLVDDPNANLILVADVSAFYYYVDHDLLHQSIINQSGKPDTADAIRALLGDVLGRGFGLPQNVGASQALSELIIVKAERQLIRKGLNVARFNDDFRVGCQTQREGEGALMLLQHELNPLGLVLNENKTRLVPREQYLEHLESFPARIREAVEADDVDVGIVDWYNNLARPEAEPQEPGIDQTREYGPPDIDEDAAMRLLGSALHRLEDTDSGWSRFEESVNRVLASLALQALLSLRSGRAAAEGIRILTADPALTPQYADYLKVLAEGGSQEVLPALSKVVSSDALCLSPWQRVWLMQPLLVRGVSLPSGIVAWVSENYKNSSTEILRARSAHVLGLHGVLAITDLTGGIDVWSEAARPDVVAGIARHPRAGVDRRESDSIRAGDVLDKWVFELYGA